MNTKDRLLPSGSAPDRLGDPNLTSSRLARWDILSEIVDRWKDGERPSLRAVLDAFPEVEREESTLFDLLYNEFWIRTEQGEKLTLAEFAREYPEHHELIWRMSNARTTIDDNLDTITRPLPPPEYPNVGECFYGYRLLEELGKGGFSMVFLAEELALGDRRVAVKLTAEGASEAETLGRLQHTNIVPVHSVRTDVLSGFTAVCMPYLGRATLNNVIKLTAVERAEGKPRSNRPILQAAQQAGKHEAQKPTVVDPLFNQGSYVEGIVRIAQGVARGLVFMHQRGIYHRDLKPANVLIGTDAVPRLLDFNLSHDADRSKPAEMGGTPAFMAPEHLDVGYWDKAALAKIGAKADLFSFGVIVYELLTGEHPFGPLVKMENWQMRLFMLNRYQQPHRPLREFNTDADSTLVELVERCLALDPAMRPESAAAVLAELEKVGARLKGRREAKTRRPKLMLAGAVAVALLAVTAVLSGVASLRLGVPPALTPAEVTALGDRALEEKDFDAAIKNYSQALTEGTATPELWDARGRAYFASGKVHLANKFRQPVNSEAFQQEGREADHAFSQAIVDFQAADPSRLNWQTQEAIGYCFANVQKLDEKREKAVSHYLQAIHLGSTSPSTFIDLADLYRSGVRGPEGKVMMAEAGELYKQAFQFEPTNTRAIYGIIQCGIHAGSNKKPVDLQYALIHMESLSKAGKMTPELHRWAAVLYCLQVTADQALDNNVQLLKTSAGVEQAFGEPASAMFVDLLVAVRNGRQNQDHWLDKATSHAIEALAGSQSFESMRRDVNLKLLFAYPPFLEHLDTLADKAKPGADPLARVPGKGFGQ